MPSNDSLGGEGGLKRTTSRASLLPQPQTLPKSSGDFSSIKRSNPSMSPKPSDAPTDDSNDNKSFSPRPTLLKRSRSMGTFETLVAPEISPGQKAVETITGKVSIPAMNMPPTAGLPVAPRTADNADRASTARFNPLFPEPSVTTKSQLEPKHYHETSKSSADLDSNSETESESDSHYSRTSLISADEEDQESPRGQDDLNLQVGPLARVDYFSHDWTEKDIADSWRYIVSRRQDMANSARLENASWRMWAKAKNHLRTISPEEVNWLKDYDVTWLYGPLYHDPNPIDDDTPINSQLNSRRSSISGNVPDETVAGMVSNLATGDTERSDSDSNSTKQYTTKNGSNTPRFSGASPRQRQISGYHDSQLPKPKSILKKKTLAQLMLEDAPELGLGVPGSTADYLRHHQYRHTPSGCNRQHMADLLNTQYKHIPSHQEDASSASMQGSSTRPPISSTPSVSSVNSIHSRLSVASSTTGHDRKVHFNDRVQQCIAVDPEAPPALADNQDEAATLAKHETAHSHLGFRSHSAVFDTTSGEDSASGNSSSEDDSDDEDTNEGGLFLGLRRPSSIGDSDSATIAALPATTLKYETDDLEEDNSDTHSLNEYTPISPTSTDSGTDAHNSQRRPGFNANYNYKAVFRQPDESMYEIVDPNVKPVDFVAASPEPDNATRPQHLSDAESLDPLDLDSTSQPTAKPKAPRIRPVASFGI